MSFTRESFGDIASKKQNGTESNGIRIRCVKTDYSRIAVRAKSEQFVILILRDDESLHFCHATIESRPYGVAWKEHQ